MFRFFASEQIRTAQAIESWSQKRAPAQRGDALTEWTGEQDWPDAGVSGKEHARV